MPDNAENCTTCGPNGLKFSRHNGRGRIEVPQDFLADKLGSIDTQIAEGMAMAERLAAARQNRDKVPATRPQPSDQQQAPSSPTRPAGNFIFDPLAMTAETQQGAPSRESQPLRGNQFTLAETEHASLLGIGPPTGPPTTNQFTLAETEAADVLGLLQETKGNEEEFDETPVEELEADKENELVELRSPVKHPKDKENKDVDSFMLWWWYSGVEDLPKASPSRMFCPAAKLRYRQHFEFSETEKVIEAETLDDAPKHAKAALQVASKPSISNDAIEKQIATELAGKGWKCDAPCKLRVDLVSVYLIGQLSVRITKLEHQKTKKVSYRVEKITSFTAYAVFEVSCVE